MSSRELPGQSREGGGREYHHENQMVCVRVYKLDESLVCVRVYKLEALPDMEGERGGTAFEFYKDTGRLLNFFFSNCTK